MQYSLAPFQKSHLTYNDNFSCDLVQKTCPTSRQWRHLQLSLGEIKMEHKIGSISCNFSKNVELLCTFGKMVHRVDWFSIITITSQSYNYQSYKLSWYSWFLQFMLALLFNSAVFFNSLFSKILAFKLVVEKFFT